MASSAAAGAWAITALSKHPGAQQSPHMGRCQCNAQCTETATLDNPGRKVGNDSWANHAPLPYTC
eukprot:3581926-Amphidinium_carterae.1